MSVGLDVLMPYYNPKMSRSEGSRVSLHAVARD